MLDKLDRFHRTRTGYALFALIELALTYLFISWAMDSGNWFDYLLTLVFFVGFLQNISRLVLSLFKPRQQSLKGVR